MTPACVVPAATPATEAATLACEVAEAYDGALPLSRGVLELAAVDTLAADLARAVEAAVCVMRGWNDWNPTGGGGRNTLERVVSRCKRQRR
jgi:hypothetical protein